MRIRVSTRPAMPCSTSRRCARAIGAEQVNLVGISYGTRVALEYLRRASGRVRTVGARRRRAAELALGSEHARNLESALDAQFALCEADAACAQRFGVPARRLDALLAELRDAAAAACATATRSRDETREDELTAAARGGRGAPVRLRAAAAAMLPRSLAEAAAGRPEVLMAQARMIESLVGEQIAQGLQLSVSCSRGRRPPAGRSGRCRHDHGHGVRRGRARAVRGLAARAGDRPTSMTPVRSDRPVLLLSGELDPVTPPRYGEAVVKHLPNGRHLVARGQGHNVMAAGCMPRLMARFVATRRRARPRRRLPRAARAARRPSSAPTAGALSARAVIEVQGLRKSFAVRGAVIRRRGRRELRRARRRDHRPARAERRRQDHHVAHALHADAAGRRSGAGRWRRPGRDAGRRAPRGSACCPTRAACTSASRPARTSPTSGELHGLDARRDRGAHRAAGRGARHAGFHRPAHRGLLAGAAHQDGDRPRARARPAQRAARRADERARRDDDALAAPVPAGAQGRGALRAVLEPHHAGGGALCDRIVVIAQGRVVADGTPEELRAQTGRPNLEDAFVQGDRLGGGALRMSALVGRAAQGAAGRVPRPAHGDRRAGRHAARRAADPRRHERARHKRQVGETRVDAGAAGDRRRARAEPRGLARQRRTCASSTAPADPDARGAPPGTRGGPAHRRRLRRGLARRAAGAARSSSSTARGRCSRARRLRGCAALLSATTGRSARCG